MTEENTDKGKEVTRDSFDEAIKNINRNLEEKFKPLKDGLDQFSSKLDSIKKEEKDDDLDFGDDDGSYITKKDLKEFGKSIGNTILTEAKKTSQETVKTTFESKMNKSSRDVEALKDFALLNQSSQDYDEAFYKDVDGEILRRVGSGATQDEKRKIAEDPNLLYDAASNVYSKWVRGGRHIPISAAERETRNLNNMEDSFEVKGRRSGDSWRPNERQVEFGLRLGMSKEKLTQHFEKTRKNR